VRAKQAGLPSRQTNEAIHLIIAAHTCQCIHTGHTIHLGGLFIPQFASAADPGITCGVQEYALTQISLSLVLKRLDVPLASAVSMHWAVLVRVVQGLAGAEIVQVVEEVEGDVAEVVVVEADVEFERLLGILWPISL